LQRNWIKNRRREMDDLPASRQHLFTQAINAVGERGEALVAEWIVNPVVHPVAGHDEVGLELLQYTIEPFVEVRTRKFATGVPRFRKPRTRFTGQADVDQVEFAFGKAREKAGFKISHVFAAIRDAVAEEYDAFWN